MIGDKMRTMLRNFQKSERAVSELIGYVFIFSTVLSAVVLVSLTAAPIIDDAQSDESQLTMENNFVQLDKQVQTVQEGGGVRIYQTELPAGQFRQLQQTEVTFEQPAASGENITVQTRPIHYETSYGASVMYEAGFVAAAPNGEELDSTHIRHRAPEAGMQTNPILRVPAVDHPTSLSAFASTRATGVAFQIEQPNPDAQPNAEVFQAQDYDGDGSPDPVEVTVTTEIPTAWEAYLNSHPAFSSVSRSGDQVTAVIDFSSIDGDRVTVKSTEIHVSFEN